MGPTDMLSQECRGALQREGGPWGLGLCRDDCRGWGVATNLHLDLDTEGDFETEREGEGWA